VAAQQPYAPPAYDVENVVGRLEERLKTFWDEKFRGIVS